MRSTDHNRDGVDKSNNQSQNILKHHLPPTSAFRVLSSEEIGLANFASVPQQYRSNPASRNKNMSFAILAEPYSSRPVSRSTSPTGRVSPFRGRGFIPMSARCKSPKSLSSSQPQSPKITKTRTLKRFGSSAAFGENITDFKSSSKRKKINTQLSKSLTDISSQNNIVGEEILRHSPMASSLPQTNKSQSSQKVNDGSTKIVTSKISQLNNEHNKKTKTKPNSKIISGEPNVSFLNSTTSTKVPLKNYKNIEAKIVTRNKPPVPSKPQILSKTKTSNPYQNNKITRQEANSKNLKKNYDNKIHGKIKDADQSYISNTVELVNAENQLLSSKDKRKENADNKTDINIKLNTQLNTEEKTKNVLKNEDLSNLIQPSTDATAAPISTTTIARNLKEEVKVNTDNINIAPIVDGRILSATSVSNALNKMNDTVVNSQTLMKETGFSKLSSSANTIIAMSNETNKIMDKSNIALNTRNATTALPIVETLSKSTDLINNYENEIKLPSKILNLDEKDQIIKNYKKESFNQKQILNYENNKILETPKIVSHDVQPIKITVVEKPIDEEVQSGNIKLNFSNGLHENLRLSSPPQASNDSEAATQKSNKNNICSKFFKACKRKTSDGQNKNIEKERKVEIKVPQEDIGTSTCFKCIKKTKKPNISIDVEEDINNTKTIWEKIKCCRKNKVVDNNHRNEKISFEPNKKKSFLYNVSTIKSSCCKFCRILFCTDKCRRKPKMKELVDSRRPSMMSKKKSLTSSVPVEEVKPKLDASLVEHTSAMKAAIPVLPVSLSWFCLIMNCIAPGTGTVFSGMFCLCFGKPRFSQKDGFRQRIWAFIIDLIIGFSQFFTVLFCLVGWGWSIWWGIIMIKLSRKNKKIAILQAQAAGEGTKQVRGSTQNNLNKDAENGIS